MRFTGSTAYYGVAESVNYFQGGSNSPLVPDSYHVSIDGRPYMIDLSQPFYRQYHRQIAPLIRTQADTTKEPGEHSLDPNGLWRRSFEDWSLGAGQRYLDRDTSVDNGFWQSKGVDVLTNKWQIQCLPDTGQIISTTDSNLFAVECNGVIYTAHGNSVQYNGTNFGVWVTVTGLATDGFNVYVGQGGNGIYKVTGMTETSGWMSSPIGSNSVIGFVNGRLMLGNNYDGTNGDGKLYNITGPGTLPTALFTPSSGTSTTWVGFAEGNSFLYAAAVVGDKSLIYGCTVLSDGTALSPPSVQGQLGNGETITAIFGYEGNLYVGSSLGVRFCTASPTGINLGTLISGLTSATAYGPTSSVQCLAAYGPFVYFGWTNYDSVSTGVGRIDTRNFIIENDLPAFASDCMSPSVALPTGWQGAVTALALPVAAGAAQGLPCFGVVGHGFAQGSHNQMVPSGTISSGYILYDLVDPKIAALIDIGTVGPITNGASVNVAVSVDGGPFNSYALINSSSTQPYSFNLGGLKGQRFEVQLTLNRDPVHILNSPLITRWTLRAYPAPIRPLTWQLPLILDESVVNRSGLAQGFDPLVELKALENMANTAVPVIYQEAHEAYTVYVQDVEFLPDALTEDHHYFNGIALVTLEGLPIPGVSN